MEPQYVAIHRDIGREIIGISCEKMGYTYIYICIWYVCIYNVYIYNVFILYYYLSKSIRYAILWL